MDANSGERSNNASLPTVIYTYGDSYLQGPVCIDIGWSIYACTDIGWSIYAIPAAGIWRSAGQ